ncbi:MAG: acylphosphatase [archaeon GB-1867-035]|nr:acylphosphatase [Candidatus Culexmicrobium profundum]
MKKRLIIIGEKVHNVGYRPFLLGIAESLGIERFYAENISIEGKQAIEVLIDTSKDQLNNFIKIINVQKPIGAKVSKIDVQDYDGNIMNINSYYKYLTAMQLVKVANIGVQMLNKQDIMIEKQDLTIEKQDLMLKKQDLMLEKQDLMIKKQDDLLGRQDQIVAEIRSLRDDLKTFLNERLLKLEMEIAKIKAKIGL